MTRNLAPLVLLFLAGALAALLGLAAMHYVGTARADAPAAAQAPGSAAPAIPPPTEATGSGSAAQPPSASLHDPIVDPAGAISDAREAKRHGWALAAIVVLILLARGLGTARKRWPGSRALRWMAGRAGLVVIGVGVVGCAAFDAVILGGSWLAAAYAAIGAGLSWMAPGGADGAA